MAAQKPHIDPYLFGLQFDAFRAFVEERAPRAPLMSFANHPYICRQEGYKCKLHETARRKLESDKWKKSEIGTGKIIEAAIGAVEIPENNLLLWQSRYGNKARSHQLLHEIRSDPARNQQVESCLFGFYHESHDAESFSELVSIFGKKVLVHSASVLPEGLVQVCSYCAHIL